MKTILVSWLGDNDFKCLEQPGNSNGLSGPVETAVCGYADLFGRNDLDSIILLSNWGSYSRRLGAVLEQDAHQVEVNRYLDRLQAMTPTPIFTRLVKVDNVTDYSEIYRVVSIFLEGVAQEYSGEHIQFVFHISPGTPTMQAIWLLLSKTEYPSTSMVKTSLEKGLELVEFPFDIAVKNQAFYSGDATFQNLKADSLENIKWQSNEMREALSLSGIIARHDDMRVLIQGETGSGKELFAALIHKNSKRADKPLVTLNCGAIPENLIESELFGHQKGAFTGADRDKKGCFELANGGTLFLDEIGELPILQQVKILRMTDRHQQRFKPVGGELEIVVDVRIIAATHRNLMEQVAAGTFREDLFYRLCDAPLNLPALRDRTGDIECLADHFVEQINDSLDVDINERKKLSMEAKQFLRAQQWPGNVRELEATVSRAYKLYSTGLNISRRDLEKSMIAPIAKTVEDSFLYQSIGGDFDVKEIELKIRAHYVVKAIRESGEASAAGVARHLGFLPGTFTKQLRENETFRNCLMAYPEGVKLLQTCVRNSNKTRTEENYDYK